MDNLIIVNAFTKKRGILESLFFNLFFKEIYIDDSSKYSFELKNLSKVKTQFLDEVRSIINSEVEDGFVKTSSIEGIEESLVIFSSVKKEELNKKTLLLKDRRIKADIFCPSEYLIGKYFSEKFKDRNVLISLLIKDTKYISLVRQGILLYVKKKPCKEPINNELRELLIGDIYDKEIINLADLNIIMNDGNNNTEIEKIFKKWVESIND